MRGRPTAGPRWTWTECNNGHVSSPPEVVSDFDAAVARIRAAGGDHNEQRRAMVETLAQLYRLHQIRTRGGDKAATSLYNQKADVSHAGRVTQGVLIMRVMVTHEVTRLVIPHVSPLYPSKNLYPGADLYPTTAYPVWLHPTNMTLMPGGKYRRETRKGSMRTSSRNAR